jgi:hypothetical protein
MSSAKLHSSKNSIIRSWLARELKNEIPELDLYGQERSLLDFAYHDLKTCLKSKWRDLNSPMLEEALTTEDCQEETREFLKVWTPKWLGKWRERVTLCQELPHLSLGHLKAKKKAAKIFKRMENGEDLKKLVEYKLINHGEVCMAGLIAENLIIEEIAHRLKMNCGKTSTDNIALEPWRIHQAVMPRIKRLTERRTPFIHLKLMTDV